jgi:peptidoglycan hydrolase-like protein with peptidoglycan-binding domain
MRVLILALSVLGILVSADIAKAGPSTTDRDLSASVDEATIADEATTQQTEDQIGLDKRKRRDIQRRLTGLGFDTRINGNFDEQTRAVIMRWQVARGYSGTGFLNTPQHQALVNESVSAAQASINSGDKSDGDHPARRRGGASHHRSGGVGGPIGAIGGVVGGVVGGVFGRR